MRAPLINAQTPRLAEMINWSAGWVKDPGCLDMLIKGGVWISNQLFLVTQLKRVLPYSGTWTAVVPHWNESSLSIHIDASTYPIYFEPMWQVM